MDATELQRLLIPVTATGAGIAAGAVIYTKAIRPVARFLSRTATMWAWVEKVVAEEWVKKTQEDLAALRAEVTPNHGSSLRDAIDRVETNQLTARERTFSLASLSGELLFECCEEGECVWVSPAWCKHAQMSREEAMGHGWLSGVYPEDRSYVRQVWVSTVAEKRKFDLKYRLADGTPVLGHAYPMRVRGSVVGWVGHLTVLESSTHDSQDSRGGIFHPPPDSSGVQPRAT